MAIGAEVYSDFIEWQIQHRDESDCADNIIYVKYIELPDPTSDKNVIVALRRNLKGRCSFYFIFSNY